MFATVIVQPEHASQQGDHQGKAPQAAGDHPIERAVEIETHGFAGPRNGAIGEARGFGVNQFGQPLVKVADFPAQCLRGGQDLVGGSGSIGRWISLIVCQGYGAHAATSISIGETVTLAGAASWPSSPFFTA